MQTISQTVPARHSVPASNSVPLGHSDPGWFLARSLCALDGDYAAVVVLLALLQLHADRGFVRASYRKLGAQCAHLPFKVVERALRRLLAAGLLEARAQPNVAGSYRVDAGALRDLISKPLPAALLIPGITPIPALQRLFADSPQPATTETIASPDSED